MLLSVPPAPVSRLAWATDVHLNFLGAAAIDAFCETILAGRPDALLLTGDIAEAPSLERLLLRVADNVRIPVYFVLGNHDFYRGSIAAVRRSMQGLSTRSPYLRWLPAAGVVELSPGVALVGHDGWSDGRFGDWDRSPVMLNDYLLIDELAFREKADRLHELQLLGDEAA